MLTCNPFANTTPNTPLDVSSLPTPLIKLTDFGLSRFIDPANPLLTTRCGSEFYSAPEIIMAQPYDGRRTDAWACGVVLFALATRVLPFDAPAPPAPAHDSSKYMLTPPPPPPKRDTKRSYMLRIAKGEYKWPGEEHHHHHRHTSSGSSLFPSSSSSWSSAASSCSSVSSYGGGLSRRSSLALSDDGHHHPHAYQPPHTYSPPPASTDGHDDPSFSSLSRPHTLPAPTRQLSHLASPQLKRLVSRLLVRDPSKRAALMDLWNDPWMKGPGAPLPPPEAPLDDDPSSPSSSTVDEVLSRWQNGLHSRQLPPSRRGSDEYDDTEGEGEEEEEYEDVTPGAHHGSVSRSGTPDCDGAMLHLQDVKSRVLGEDQDMDWFPTGELIHKRSRSGRLVFGDKEGNTIPIVARQEVISS